MNWLTGQ